MDGALLAALDEGQPEAELRAILFFDDKADLSPESLPKNEIARRQEIVNRLHETADLAQRSILPELLQLQARGQIGRFDQLWIANGIAIRGTASAIAKLASHSNVAHLELDEGQQRIDPPFALDRSEATSGLMGEAWGVERIQADKVWEALDVRGQGVTVAIVDSGVALEHPDLIENYRGFDQNGELEHKKHWLHTEILTSTQPFDNNGHGTHVTGTAVGRNGIGVAPEARWIAAAIADEYGIIYDSNILAAFQWLLAPGDDSKAAPDVANNSWGGAGDQAKFVDEIKILHEAGIITVFAAGNSGPGTGTVLAPGSYPETITVGASDEEDAVAWFSGRGPSPLTEELKPLLLAPGTQILSSMPGDGHTARNGTSMAAPHVSGVIALLLAADPKLNLEQVRETLAQTAMPVAKAHPNYDSGWGRLNAYTAVLSRLAHGRLAGSFEHDGRPLADVTISVKGGDEVDLSTTSDGQGVYEILLPPGSYDLRFSHFGFADKTLPGVTIVEGQETRPQASLQQQPMGLLAGRIIDSRGQGLKASLSVTGTPKEAETGEDGRFSFWFPVGKYELVVETAGFRSQQIPIELKAKQATRIDSELEAGPAILLLDSGQVRYDSAAAVYQEALVDAGYSSDLWIIDQPQAVLPGQEMLAAYDVLIWSAPSNSPGQLSASEVLTDYLGAGGNLLISGQDVARLDGQPGFEEPWFRHKLQAQFSGEVDLQEIGTVVEGLDEGPFAGLRFELNGQTSAAGQIKPDLMRARKDSLTRPILSYANSGTAGLEAGTCEPYRIVQLGFGLEGVDGAEMRQAVLKRSIEALLAPRVTAGARWLPEDRAEITLPGEDYLYELTMQNMSEVMTDTFDLHVEPFPWATNLLTTTLTLGPCTKGNTLLRVQVPPDAALDQAQELRVTAAARGSTGTGATFVLRQKTPGALLLVDDDRFFEREDIYMKALETMGYEYDVWDTTPNGRERGGPTAEFLQAYETVIWFTGYDWFAPVQPAENEALAAFMDTGGRLFLSSQDFLYYNWNTPLTREHLGVMDYREVVTPTAIYAHKDLALSGSLAGPLPLNYAPYQNFSDGIVPQAGATPFLWLDAGLVGGVTQAGTNGGRAVFWSLPWETLPADERVSSLQGVMGWLSDLGESTFEIDERYGTAGEARTYTLTVRNLAQAPTVTLAISNTLPEGMGLVAGSLAQEYRISPSERTISWQGTLGPGEEKLIHYEAITAKNTPAGARLDNRMTIRNMDTNSSFRKEVPLWIDSPDLSESTLTSVVAMDLPQRTVTYTLALRNIGLLGAEVVTAVLKLPDSLHLLTNTLRTSGGEVSLVDEDVLWRGEISGGTAVTTTVVLTQALLTEAWLPAAAIIEDGLRDPLIFPDLRYAPPVRSFFPFATGS